MSLRCLRVLVLLIVAFSISSNAQSLGDAARQLRAERQKSTAPHAKVITNDDIAPSEQNSELSPDGAKNEEISPAANQGTEASAETADPSRRSSNKTLKDSAKERDEQEIETQKRTAEINQRHLERIATLRAQIDAAQSELAKIQRDQVESTYQFRRTLGVSPNPGTYDQQQHILAEQTEAHRDLIHSLNSQLEDAEEAARHAGVRHASD